MHTRGDVTLRNVDGQSVHRQLEQLQAMYAGMMPDDSIEANRLRDTIRLLTEIEKQLTGQGVATH